MLKKAKDLYIEKICPLHGPILEEDLGYYIDLYDKWSGYRPETEGVCICYTSVYGNTKKAAELLRDELAENGVETIEMSDLARCDMAEAVEDAFATIGWYWQRQRTTAVCSRSCSSLSTN